MAKEKEFAAPELYGWTLSAVATLAEWFPSLSHKLASDGQFFQLQSINNLTDEPTTIPIPADYNHFSRPKAAAEETFKPTKCTSVPFISAAAYQEAYRSGKTTPTEVAERLIKVLDETRDCHWMRVFDETSIRLQAEASTQRWKNAEPLGPLDGVFVSIKEEMAIKGFETRLGSAFINVGCPEQEDSTVVKRLREAGAIIIGHTSMNEIGWDVFTVNPVTGTPKNPYKPKCSCGGSSGGSGGSVAAGLVPISIGADSGGSIRIPSSFCGVYGLKPTYGRISTFGSYPIAPSLDVFGPLAATPDDLALTYQAIAGPDPKYPPSLSQPTPSLQDYDKIDSLQGIKIAIVPEWNEKTVEPAILSQLETFAKHFEKLGAKIVEMQTPPLDMPLVKRAHLTTICTEMNNYARTFPAAQQRQFLPHTRLLMAVSRHLSGSDYVRAQQIRTMTLRQLCQLYKEVDLILMPTTAIQTPEIPEKALSHGLSNTSLTVHTMNFVTLASFAGVPALSFPAGFTDDGRPIGLQLVAAWWNEALLLRMAKVCENTPGIERKTPAEDGYWFGQQLL